MKTYSIVSSILAVIFFLLLPPSQTHAHEGGHGPKLTDVAKKGGVLASVTDSKKHSHEILYKAELVRIEEGTVRVYVYDKDMKAVNLVRFSATANAAVEVKVKKKFKHTPFTLALKEDAFIGKMPVPEKKPYTIDVTIREGEKELLASFENLD